MLQYQIDRIEHQVAEDRVQSGVFLIGPLERIGISIPQSRTSA